MQPGVGGHCPALGGGGGGDGFEHLGSVEEVNFPMEKGQMLLSTFP